MKTKFLTLKYVENYPSLCHTTFPVCPRVCGELERVHHAVARLVDGPLPGPHGVLKLHILKVYPHLTNTGVTLVTKRIGNHFVSFIRTNYFIDIINTICVGRGRVTGGVAWVL